MEKIDCFDGKFAFLSNFFICKVLFDGLLYDNSEAAFQAQKCAIWSDRIKFIDLLPGKSKRLGRKVPLRQDWEQVKDQVMYLVVRTKFTQHPELRAHLLATGETYLEEGNTWDDTYWGVCRGTGQNKLGHILMVVRSELLKGLY
jgi:ribA/ribD-fused uncharacterized protein